MPVYTFTRNSIAYLSDGTQVAANVPRFEAGKFGKAVMVEEGTTNIFPHSKSFEECSGTHIGDPSNSNSVTTVVGGGWSVSTHYNSATIKISEDGGLFGSKRLSFIHDGSSGWKGASSSTWSVVAGKTYTVTVWARANQASTKSFTRGFAFHISGGQQYTFNWPDGYPTAAKNVGKWVRGICTFTATADESGTVYLYGLTDGEAGLIIDYDGLQVEEKPYATSFTDGTRAAERLIIPTERVLNPREGTIEQWVYVNDIMKRQLGDTANCMLLYIPRYGNNSGIYLFHRGDSPFWEFRTYDDDGTYTTKRVSNSYTPNGWHLFSLRWTLDRVDLFIDGVLRGTIDNPKLPSTFHSYAAFGRSTSNRYFINSLIDDLRISNRARSDAEILAAYQSGRPAPVDEWTMLKLDFSYFEFWNEFQSIYFLLSHIEYKPDLFVEEYVINLEHVDYEIKLEVIGLAISGSTITLKATFPDSAGDLQELENVVVKIYAPGKVLLKTIPATKISTGVYTADYTIPEDKEGQFDYEFSGSLESRTIVGRSSFDSHWR